MIRHLGLVDYEPTWRRMQAFTDRRDTETRDEIWFLQHPPVFTMGMNASPEHLLTPGDIPVIKIDRGGQVTYHGPGQLVVYPIIHLVRRQIRVVDFVTSLEAAMIQTAAHWDIPAGTDPAKVGQDDVVSMMLLPPSAFFIIGLLIWAIRTSVPAAK